MGFAAARTVVSHVHEHHCYDVGAAATRSVCTIAQHIALKAATFAADETDNVSIYATGADVEATNLAGKGKKKQKRARDESGTASRNLQVAYVLAECLCIFMSICSYAYTASVKSPSVLLFKC